MNRPYTMILCQDKYSSKVVANLIREALQKQFLGYEVIVEIEQQNKGVG